MFKVRRKDENYAIVRVAAPVLSKKNGRRGTRRNWKKRHFPRDFTIYIGGTPTTSITPGGIIQGFLSSKHLTS